MVLHSRKDLEYKDIKFEARIFMESVGRKTRIEIDLYSIKNILWMKKRSKFMHIEQIVSEKISVTNFVKICKDIIKENIDFRQASFNEIGYDDFESNLYDIVLHQASSNL